MKTIRQKEIIDYTCDMCNSIIADGYLPVEVDFGYGSIFDGEKKQFCGMDCFIKWAENLKANREALKNG